MYINVNLPYLKYHCGKDFSTDQELTDHVSTTHASNVWVCSADDCDLSYCEASRIWKHFRRIHLGIMLRQCPYPTCTYSHEEKGYLNCYLYKVHGHKPTIYCENCWKVLCGTPMKPYECPEDNCKHAYRNKFWLDNHIKTDHPEANTDPLRFTCTIFLKIVKSQQALKSHMAQKH